jgi:hypothetical protein
MSMPMMPFSQAGGMNPMLSMMGMNGFGGYGGGMMGFPGMGMPFGGVMGGFGVGLAAPGGAVNPLFYPTVEGLAAEGSDDGSRKRTRMDA